METSSRRYFRIIVVVLSLVGLLVLPGLGHIPSIRAPLHFGYRIIFGLTEGEKAELEWLTCAEIVARNIPEGTSVSVHAPEDSYMSQRFMEIIFPAHDVLPAGDAEVDVYLDVAHPGAGAFRQYECAGRQIVIAAND